MRIAIMRWYVTCLAVLWAPAALAEPTHFVAFGDLQDESAEGRAADARLIAEINALEPAFSVFIGDIKGGGGCTEALYDEVRTLFDAHEAPLVYTPGDNEWTDCWREPAGGYDPAERKMVVVERFTAEGLSLGRKPMSLDQQDGTVENARWQWRDVVFATLHMPGSNNNLQQQPGAIAEHIARDEANAVWLETTFATARDADAAAIALFIHGNPHWEAQVWQPTGFDRFRAQLAAEANDFGRPVLVMHGDTHTFRIDKPFREGVPDLTRAEVFGPPQRGAIIVEVNPNDPLVFRFQPMLLAD